MIPDYYRPLAEMTVFDFGRTGNANENLTEVPQSFTIGFSSDTSFLVVSEKVRDIVEKSRKQNDIQSLVKVLERKNFQFFY